MTISESMRDILDAESRAISQIPYTPDYDRAISLIIEHVHRRHGKLVTAGMGKAGQIALNIATTFSSTGTPAVNLHPSEAQHGDLGVLQPDDILLLVSARSLPPRPHPNHLHHHDDRDRRHPRGQRDAAH